MSVDPIGFEAGDVTLYRYCFARVPFSVDPLGLQVVEEGPLEIKGEVELVTAFLGNVQLGATNVAFRWETVFERSVLTSIADAKGCTRYTVTVEITREAYIKVGMWTKKVVLGNLHEAYAPYVKYYNQNIYLEEMEHKNATVSHIRDYSTSASATACSVSAAESAATFLAHSRSRAIEGGMRVAWQHANAAIDAKYHEKVKALLAELAKVAKNLKDKK